MGNFIDRIPSVGQVNVPVTTSNIFGAGGVNSGGSGNFETDLIEVFDGDSVANTTDRGDLQLARYNPGASVISSVNRAIVAGGQIFGENPNRSEIDYFDRTLLVGNSLDRGDFPEGSANCGGSSNNNIAFFAGGGNGITTPFDLFQDVIRSLDGLLLTGGILDKGDLTSIRGLSGNCPADNLKTFTLGGFDTLLTSVDNIESFDNTTTAISNASAVGDLSAIRGGVAGEAQGGNGFALGGSFNATPVNIIEFFSLTDIAPISTSDKGDTVGVRTGCASGSNSSKLFLLGGQQTTATIGTFVNMIQDVNANTTLENAVDRADLIENKGGNAGC